MNRSYSYIFLFAALVGVFSSCKKEDDPTLVNAWMLKEVLMDPGDGSGAFEAVQSDKTVSFYNDGTVSSNGSLCSMIAETGNPSSGTYSTADSTIAVNDCTNSGFPLSFVMNGSSLILNYPCIERCAERYELK